MRMKHKYKVGVAISDRANKNHLRCPQAVITPWRHFRLAKYLMLSETVHYIDVYIKVHTNMKSGLLFQTPQLYINFSAPSGENATTLFPTIDYFRLIKNLCIAVTVLDRHIVLMKHNNTVDRLIESWSCIPNFRIRYTITERVRTQLDTTKHWADHSGPAPSWTTHRAGWYSFKSVKQLSHSERLLRRITGAVLKLGPVFVHIELVVGDSPNNNVSTYIATL